VLTDLKTFNSSLYVGGNFTNSQGTSCYWSGSYNGSTFSFNTTPIGGGGPQQFEVFDNQLYNSGTMSSSGDAGVAKWTGSSWTMDGNFNTSHGSIYARGTQLYVGSHFGVVSYKTTGSYTSLPAFGTSDDIDGIIEYNGSIIVAGEFTNFGTTTLNHVTRWDGSTWQPLGTGITGSIRTIAVYNNELYVAGVITNAGGTPVTNIAKWNGSTWSAVGTGLVSNPNGIRDMVVFNNALYVVGYITSAGGQPTKHVAKWNGITWTPLPLTPSHQMANCIEVYNNKIYVGTFDTDTAHLYRLDSELGINDVSPYTNISVFPNPANNHVTIDLKETFSKYEISIFDISGKEVYAKSINDELQFISIDISSFIKGVYMIAIISEDKRIVIPLIKN
jgi:hypothetical protein